MIKVIFLFFLLLNAAYFYMQFDGTGEPATSTVLQQPPLPQGVDKLILLRERGLGGENALQKTAGRPQAKPIDTKLPPPEASQEKSPRASHEPACFTLGPFVKANVVKRSSKAIAALGVDVEQRKVSQRTPRGYWVYLPASKSYQAAKRKVTELQKKGLKDVYIMGKGSHKNAISLGLFTRENAARNRFQQVKKLGLKAVLETQYRVTEQTWLDIMVPGGQGGAIVTITEMADGLRGGELDQRQCQ